MASSLCGLHFMSFKSLQVDIGASTIRAYTENEGFVRYMDCNVESATTEPVLSTAIVRAFQSNEVGHRTPPVTFPHLWGDVSNYQGLRMNSYLDVKVYYPCFPNSLF